MRIDRTTRDAVGTLKISGEFDTFYVPALAEAVESLIADGCVHIALDLSCVRFINSTALGAIIKALKSAEPIAWSTAMMTAKAPRLVKT